MPGLNLDANAETAVAETTVDTVVEVKPTAVPIKPTVKPAPKTQVAAPKPSTLTITAPKAAKRLEPHFKAYAQGKKITVAVTSDDTLTLSGDDAVAAKDYVLRYGDVTKVE